MSSRMKLMGEFLDAIKGGFKQKPPAVRGDIPKGYTLDSYQEAVELGLFDNGAPPSEVLEMMRQNGTVGKLDGLQYHDGTSDISRMREGIQERVGDMNKVNEGTFMDVFPRDSMYRNQYEDLPYEIKPTAKGYKIDGRQAGSLRDYSTIPRMNKYGNGEFIDADKGLLGKPDYVRPYSETEWPTDPSASMVDSIRQGKANVVEPNGTMDEVLDEDNWLRRIDL
jgi:hypothetical protein